jgi:hypothetical protein
MLKKQTKHSGAFGGKIARDHFIFPGIIVAGVLMSGNFKREGVVSSKLESQLRQSAENAALL